MIQLHGVSKIFESGNTGSRWAVDDITLDIAPRQITVLKGPSGSGKTTLLSLIGCMTRPSAGRIFFAKREVSSLPERYLAKLRSQHVGFVFQNYNLIKGITVMENVLLPALPLGIPIKSLRTSAKSLLTDLDLYDLASQPVQHLSGGEQQRVAIARALINQPRLIIADEPTAHLDTAMSEHFMTIVSRLKDQGRTIVIASHDPLISGHGNVDRVVGLRDGRIDNESSGP